MKQKMAKKIIFYIAKISAFIGSLLIFLSISEKSNLRHRNENLIYILLIGLAFILPYVIYHYFNGSLFDKDVRENNIKVYLPILNQKTRNTSGTIIKNEWFIYLFNDTDKNISASDIVLELKKLHVFSLRKNENIAFNNGILLTLDENTNLNARDKKNQLLVIAENDKIEKNVSQDIDFAFIIEYPFLGDLNYEIET